MTVPAFEYHEPETLPDAVRLLEAHGDDAKLLAGGTALVLMLRYRLVRPGVVIALDRVAGLADIRLDGDLSLGAMVTHRAVERSPEARRAAPLLAQACSRVGSAAIRTMGTIGGNIVQAEAASDPAPALLALDARVTLTGPAGERTVPLDGFFKDFYETDLRRGEILTTVRVPRVPPSARSAFVKYTCLSEEDRALVSVAALLVPGADGACADVRIGLGGVAPTPIRARSAEEVLRGRVPTPERIAEAAEAAAAATDPTSDRQGTAQYRRDMTRVWVERVLERLARAPSPS